MKRNKIISILLMSFVPIAFGQSSYLCIADLATGFKFNNNTKRWESTNFNIKNSKYIIKKNTDGVWEWKDFGKNSMGVTCNKDFNESGYLRCESLIHVNFNNKSLRYILYYPVGYVNIGIAGKEGDDTPSLEIGTCSQIN